MIGNCGVIIYIIWINKWYSSDIVIIVYSIYNVLFNIVISWIYRYWIKEKIDKRGEYVIKDIWKK